MDLKLVNVVNALQKLTLDQTKNLALKLGVELNVLIDIEREQMGETRKAHYIQAWLEFDTKASWEKIIAALKKIRMDAIATHITSQYLPKAKDSISNAQSSDPTLLSVPVDVLVTVTQDTLSDPTPPQVQAPELRAVQLPVSTRESPPETGLSSILQPMNSVTSSNTPLAQTTSTTALSTALFNNPRAQDIAREAAQLEKRFVDILMHTKICFAEKEAESGTFLERFKITLTTLPLSRKYLHLKFLKNKKEHIKRARNSEEIFDILEDYWNYSDYDLLEYIIKQFGMLGLQEEMDIYIAELEQFEKKTTIRDYDSASLGEMIIPEDFRTVTIEQGKDPLKCTLYDVRQFENDVVNQAALSKFAVFRKSVKSSSVKIVLAFPPEAYADLLDIFDEEYKKKHDILSVVFNQDKNEPERRKRKATTVYRGCRKAVAASIGFIPSSVTIASLVSTSSLPSTATTPTEHTLGTQQLSASTSSHPSTATSTEEQTLDIDNLIDVKCELLDVAHNWKGVGMALRLKPALLHRIQADHPGDVRECLTEALTEWLNKSYNVSRFGPPSWKLLVAAIANPAGGNDRALAERIALKHNVPPRAPTQP